MHSVAALAFASWVGPAVAAPPTTSFDNSLPARVAPPAAQDALSFVPPIAPPDAAPQIVGISLSALTIHPSETVHVDVHTSTNVASVELRVAGNGISMPRSDYGIFHLDYTVPSTARFVAGAYDVAFIARNTAGLKVVEHRAIRLLTR